MMTRVFYAIICSLMIATSVVPQTKSDPQTEKLIGAVKTVQSRISRTDKGQILDAVQQDKIFYSRDGKELERMIFDDYGFFIGIESALFDNSGNKTETVLKDSRGQTLERRTFSYTKGLVTEISQFDSTDELISKQTNSYAENGNLAAEIYLENEKEVGKTVYNYGNGQKLLSVSFFLPNGVKAVAPIGPCLNAHKVVYEYDQGDRLIGTTSYEKNGTVKTTWHYSYNAKGLLQEESREDFWSRIIYSFSYEFDAKGNWIKKVTRLVSQPKNGPFHEAYERTTITNRDINYY